MNKIDRGALSLHRRSPRFAFTLIELTVVIVIISLLVSMVVINASGTLQRFHQQRSLQQVISYDQRARQLCISSGRSVELTLSPDSGRLSLRYTKGAAIDSVVVKRRSSEKLVVLSGDGEQSDGAVISISPAGTSQLYAVGLRNERERSSQWVLFLGSGQVKVLDSQQQLEAWIASAD